MSDDKFLKRSIRSKREHYRLKRRRKKYMWGLILVGLISSIAIATVQAAEVKKQVSALYQSISVWIDGKQITSVQQPLILEETDQVLLPLETVQEMSKALGVNYHYDPGTGKISLVTPNKQNPPLHNVRDLTVLRNVGQFYIPNDNTIHIARRQFTSGLLVDYDGTLDQVEFVVELGRQYSGFTSAVGVVDKTQNSKTSFNISFYANDNLLPELSRGPIRPADYPMYINATNLGNYDRLKVVIEFFQEEDSIGEYEDVTVGFGYFNFTKK